MSSGNRNLDLDIRGMRPWEKIRDLPAERDFAAGNADPEPPARTPRRQIQGVDSIRTEIAELIAQRDQVPFNVAAGRVPTDPRKLQGLLRELRARTNNE